MLTHRQLLHIWLPAFLYNHYKNDFTITGCWLRPLKATNTLNITINKYLVLYLSCTSHTDNKLLVVRLVTDNLWLNKIFHPKLTLAGAKTWNNLYVRHTETDWEILGLCEFCIIVRLQPWLHSHLMANLRTWWRLSCQKWHKC